MAKKWFPVFSSGSYQNTARFSKLRVGDKIVNKLYLHRIKKSNPASVAGKGWTLQARKRKK